MVQLERRAERQALGHGLPIVAISGRWGKTTVARLLEAMIRPVYPHLAVWTDQGVYVNGRRQPGELLPWQEALRALTAGELDLALQELDAPTVNAVGLPREAYALGIVTSFCGNDEACLIDPRAAIERQAQAAVARAIHPTGALVLNADDHAVAGEGRVCSGDVIYYGGNRRNPIIKAHLAAGGRAVYISGGPDGMIVLGEGTHTQPVLPVREVALSLGGAIVFQAQNALAAVAAAWRLGVPPATIAETLRGFTSTPTAMPGACNEFRVGGATVMVDRLTDPYSARSLVRGIRRVRGVHRRLVLLPACSDLDDDALTEIGRLMGGSFDLVVLHEDDCLAAAPAGDGDAGAAGAEALRAGIAANVVPPMVLAMPEEGPALERLLKILRAGDLALVLASDLALVLRTLLTYRPTDANNEPAPDGAPVWQPD
ncbi:MAG TPA: hypothetical protein VFW96_21135 [Thermomicrobiales bacterium]|nr:hypothetical protein [Thermomicrobiales bacterium]